MEPSPFFVLRTPLLPFETLTRLGDGLEAPAALADPARLAVAWARDREQLRERLKALLQANAIRDAIFVASPDLDDAIERWLTDPADQRGDATERAVFKYVTRMSARATPFGMFAGTSVGKVGQTTHLAVRPRAECRRHTRLDMDYLVLLADALARDPAFAPAVLYTPNSSLYRSGDHWRYVETRMQGKTRSRHLVAVDDSAALTATIERARQGAPRAALASALIGEDIAAADADAFVGELIESQILLPDVECPITGLEPLAHLEAVARRAPEGAATAARLARVAADLDAIDGEGIGVDSARYRRIATTLEAFPAPVDRARLFQVDVVRPAPAATLGREIVDEIARGVDLLRRLVPAAPQTELTQFRAAFSARYEQREVPLVEALDEEGGVGATLAPGGDRDASPLLRDLEFPATGPETIDWGRRDQALLARVGQTLLAGHHELALTERDLEEMANNEAPALPDACAAMATVISRDPQPNVAGDFRVLLHDVFGPSGATLLGRFCHADPALSSSVRQHLRDEEALDPDALYAEIVHLPEGRVGNILLRPMLRQYEIPYLGRSGASSDHQIPVTDLTVSVSGDRFILRSCRLARRIVPRLTSAHNFTRLSLNVYRFLCLLQSDGRLAGCTWTWGVLGALPFLPRVTCGRFVFALATWRVTNDDLAPLKAASAGVAQYEAVQTWRAARRLPRWVALADDDNTLPVDLDNALAVDALVQLLKNRNSATLTEIFRGPNDLCAHSDDGRYVHELVIPWVRAPRDGVTGGDITPPPAQNEGAPTIRRTFPPGSEWIYAKWYSGPAAADRVLTDIIGPVSRALVAKNLIDRWWFIRYADPDPHLRWRLRRTPTTRTTTIQRRIETAAASLVGPGLVRRLVFDTYEREVERYGGAIGVEAAEQYFWADSEAVLDALKSLGDDDADADRRWRLAIPGVDTLLSDLGLDLDAKLRLAQRLREQFGDEFHADAAFGRQLGPKYRSVRADLEHLVATDGAADADRPWREALAGRSARAREAVETLHAATGAQRLTSTIEGLAESYVHMHLNRLFRDEQRAHELVIYDFLVRLYEGLVARRRTSRS